MESVTSTERVAEAANWRLKEEALRATDVARVVNETGEEETGLKLALPA